MTFNSGELIQPQRALFSLPTREGQSLPTSLTAHKKLGKGSHDSLLSWAESSCPFSVTVTIFDVHSFSASCLDIGQSHKKG